MSRMLEMPLGHHGWGMGSYGSLEGLSCLHALWLPTIFRVNPLVDGGENLTNLGAEWVEQCEKAALEVW